MKKCFLKKSKFHCAPSKVVELILFCQFYSLLRPLYYAFAALQSSQSHARTQRAAECQRESQRGRQGRTVLNVGLSHNFLLVCLCVSVCPLIHTHVCMFVCVYICSQIEIQIQAPHMAHSASSGPLAAVVFVVFEHFWPQWEMHSVPAAGK